MHTRRVWIQCLGFPLQGWSERLLLTYGRRSRKVVEIDNRKLREDCSAVKLLLEVKISDQILSLVSLNLIEVDYPVLL